MMNLSPATVRPALPGDLGAILDIEKSCRTVTWSAGAFVAELSGERSINLVALDENGTLCGFVFAALAADELEIYTLAVDPKFRRRGFATRLLRAAAEEARRRGAASVYLEVRSKNQPAQSLYLFLGFDIRWIRRKYYSDDGDDAIVMSADLDTVVPLHS
jgi:ribosomal-protein-alanine acetyltransferase